MFKRARRFLSMVLVFCIIFTSMPATPAYAARKGNIEGVDYTRIKENTTLIKNVTFEIGGRKFKGQLSNGESLSIEEMDKVIRKVMNKEKITSGMLKGAELRANTKFEYKNGVAATGALISEGLMSFIGIHNSHQLSQVMFGDEKVPTDVVFYAETVLYSALAIVFNASLGLATGKTFANALGALKTTAELGMRECIEFIEANEKVQQSVLAAIALERFYAQCNEEIRAEEKRQGIRQWKLTCAQTVWADKTIFKGIPVLQYWRLTCDLERVTENIDPMDWGGVYEGPMQLEIWHDMTAFDEQFLNKFYLSSGLPFSKMAAYYAFDDQYGQASTLTKTLTKSDFSIGLDSSIIEKATHTETFSFAGFEDNSSFWSMHPIFAGLNVAGYNMGHFSYSGGGGRADYQVDVTHTFVGEMCDENMGIQIDLYGWDSNVYGTLTTPYTNENWDYSDAGTGHLIVAKDYDIFSDLYSKPKLTIGGE